MKILSNKSYKKYIKLIDKLNNIKRIIKSVRYDKINSFECIELIDKELESGFDD